MGLRRRNLPFRALPRKTTIYSPSHNDFSRSNLPRRAPPSTKVPSPLTWSSYHLRDRQAIHNASPSLPSRHQSYHPELAVVCTASLGIISSHWGARPVKMISRKAPAGHAGFCSFLTVFQMVDWSACIESSSSS